MNCRGRLKVLRRTYALLPLKIFRDHDDTCPRDQQRLHRHSRKRIRAGHRVDHAPIRIVKVVSLACSPRISTILFSYPCASLAASLGPRYSSHVAGVPSLQNTSRQPSRNTSNETLSELRHVPVSNHFLDRHLEPTEKQSTTFIAFERGASLIARYAGSSVSKWLMPART